MKTSIIMVILLSGVLFAQNGSGIAQGIQQGGLNAGQSWSSGHNIGAGAEDHAKGEMAEPGKGWSTQEGEDKGNDEDAKKENKE